MKKLLLVLLTLAMASTANAYSFTFMWDAPSVDVNHSPATSYIVQTSRDALSWATVDTVAVTQYVVELQQGESLYVRVAGVSAAGFAGVWSQPSGLLSFTPPGQPGQPYWVRTNLVAAPSRKTSSLPMILRK